MSGLVVGLDLGGTNMQVGVVDERGGVVVHLKRKTRAERGPDAVFDRVIETVERACAEVGVAPSDLAGVGLAVAAAVDAERGVALDAPNIGWRDFPLARCAGERLGCPVTVENDVNAAVLGEHAVGAIRGEPEALGVWIGTGIGGAIILNGRLHRGGLGTAGEIGHVTLLPSAPTGLKHFEQTCSRSAIADRLTRLARTRETLLRDDLESGPIRSGAIGRAYAAGDPLTREIVDEAAGLIGVALGSAVTLLGMPVVLLGGGLVEALGEPFVGRVAEAGRATVFPESVGPVRFTMTALREKAGVLGAAARAREALSAGR